MKSDLGTGSAASQLDNDNIAGVRSGEGSSLEAAPLPGLCSDGAAFLAQGSDTRPYFSCGLHTVLLQSGSLPLCQPSPF